MVLALHPPVAECSQAGQHFAVFHPACLFLAPNDVVDVANGKALNDHSALESILKAFNPVGSEHQVKVKRTFSKLDKILPSKNLVLLPVVQGEPQLPQGRKKCPAVLRGLLHEEVRVLSGVGEPKDDRSRFSQKQVLDTMTRKSAGDVLSKPVAKGHDRNQARKEGWPRTSGDRPPWCQTL